MIFGEQNRKLSSPNSSVSSSRKVKVVKSKRKKSFKVKHDPSSMYPSVFTSLGFELHQSNLTSKMVHGCVCVTGIDGFVASWIVEKLLHKGYYVRGTIQDSEDDIAGLLQLPNAVDHLTVVKASLLTPESCDLAIEGCEYVIHTGTPSSCAVRDPYSETMEPGVHSIGSRMHCIIPMMTNFIQACARAKIKRLVLTSSIAAMADAAPMHTTVKDTQWNLKSTLERNPHFLSLKLAEEAAWQLVDQLPKNHKFELVSINAGTIVGPVLCESSMPSGNQIVFDLISGKYSALVDLNWAMIDVRDCAKAHILALENSMARGRFICVHQTVWLCHIADILANNGYSGRDLPWKVGLPNWVARFPSYATQLGQVGASLYAQDNASHKNMKYLNDKIKEVLHIEFTDTKNTIVDTANNLLKWGLIKPWDEDHVAVDCACCKAPFTFYRRKHHCRECGIIICSECSKSRAVVEGLTDKARLCDSCVRNSVPALLELLQTDSVENQRKAIIALESLMDNPGNHDFITRTGGLPLIMGALHVEDSMVSKHAAGTLLALSTNISSSLQMVLEGAVLQMLEVSESTSTWRIALQTLRNMWRQVNTHDFRRMLHAVARVSSDAAIGALKGNILLTFVHMMETSEIPALLDEGLATVLYTMLKSPDVYPRCAAAHGIKHLIPVTYNPDTSIHVEPYVVDDHEELLANSALSDLQFLIKGDIQPINAHKVVLFFRNAFFKNMFGSATCSQSTIEITNCSHDVFALMLRFLYTGRVEIHQHTAKELLVASSDYQVHELQKRTEAFLSRQITIENVIELAYLADKCYAEDLKRVCIGFLMQHVHRVVALPSFEQHANWASQEILAALSTILGPAWESSYLDVVRTFQHDHMNTDVTLEILPSSPVATALRDRLSPQPATKSLQPESTQFFPEKKSIKTFQDEPPISPNSVDVSSSSLILSPTIRQRVWSDDVSERSESGVC